MDSSPKTPSPRTYFSFHSYADYKACPLRYLWKHIEKKRVTKPDNPLNKILGIVWNDMLETFYRGKKYLLGPEASKWMVSEITAAFARREKELNVFWPTGEREKFLKEGIDAVPGILSAIKLERLLGDTHAVEKTLYADVPNNGRIGGRLDLLITRDLKILLDFKGTAKKENTKKLDDDQLYWYDVLVEASEGSLPDLSGFWLLRFGCVKWVEVSKKKLAEFMARLDKAVVGVREKKFDATPGWKACRFCDYNNQCPAWDTYQIEHKKKSSLPDGDDGFSEVLDVE